MNRIALSLFLGVLASAARAEYNGPVMYQCDPAGSRVRIDVIDRQPPPLLSGSRAPIKLQLPDFESIDRESRQEEGLGPLRGPSKVVQVIARTASAQATIVRTSADASGTQTSRTDKSVDLRSAPRPEYARRPSR